MSASEKLPKIAEQYGFTRLAFEDDFDSIDTVDVGGTGEAGYRWYVRRPFHYSTLTPEDYSVENSVLTVKAAEPTSNYCMATMDPLTGKGFTFNTGYLEYRLRIPRPRKNTEGEKGSPAIWSLPVHTIRDLNDQQGNVWIEMDWMEYWGDAFYTITLHQQRFFPEGKRESWVRNSNYSQHGLNDGQWHTMAFLWDIGLIKGYMDGEEVFSLTFGPGIPADPAPHEGDYQGPAPLKSTFTPLDSQAMPIILGSGRDNPMELDWIRVWQH